MTKMSVEYYVYFMDASTKLLSFFCLYFVTLNSASRFLFDCFTGIAARMYRDHHIWRVLLGLLLVEYRRSPLVAIFRSELNSLIKNGAVHVVCFDKHSVKNDLDKRMTRKALVSFICNFCSFHLSEPNHHFVLHF